MGRKRVNASIADLLRAYHVEVQRECAMQAMRQGDSGLSQADIISILKTLHSTHGRIPGRFPKNAKNQLSSAVDPTPAASKTGPSATATPTKARTLKTVGAKRSLRYCTPLDAAVARLVRRGSRITLTNESWLYEAIARYAEQPAPDGPQYISVISGDMRTGKEGTNPDVTAFTEPTGSTTRHLSREVVAFDAKASSQNWVTRIGPASTYKRFANRTFLVMPIVCSCASLVPLFFNRELRDFAAQSGFGIIAIAAIPLPGEARTKHWWNNARVWEYSRVAFYTVVDARSHVMDSGIEHAFLSRVMTASNIAQRPDMQTTLTALRTHKKLPAGSPRLHHVWEKEFKSFGIV